VRLTRTDRVRTGNETRGEIDLSDRLRERSRDTVDMPTSKVGQMRDRWVERLSRPGNTRGRR
jgi:hypothetical protein